MKYRLLLALLLPFAACGLQLLLWDPWIKPYVWFLFFPAAFFAGWLGRLYGGVLNTLISAALVWYVFIPPRHSFVLDDPSSVFSVIVFVVMGVLFAQLFERLHRAQSLARAGLDATFEQAAVGVALLSPDGHWLRTNRKLCDIVGYTQQELLSRTFQDITHPDDLDADLDNVRRMLAGEIDSYSMEKRYFHKNGSLVWINLTVGLAWKSDNTPDYFISVVEDISRRKAVENALAENERRLQEASHLARLGHWQWNVERDEHLWSEEVFDIYGRDPELPPAVYPEVQQYFTPASWARLSATVEKSMADGVPYECDAEVVRPCGEHRWITARGKVERDAEGKVTSLYGTVQDITARKLAEDEIRQRNAELEQFNRASVGRELRMIELKRQVNLLSEELGRAPPYDLSFVNKPENISAS